MDKLGIDSHKLFYHVSRLNDWLNGRLVYPIYMEISPTGACNHRCIYCALDYMKYQKRSLDANVLKERLAELGNLGLKSVMYAGEGEPLMHEDITDIINHTKKSGIDVAITTNGVLLKEDLTEKILGNIEWIKVSIDAATCDTYANVHRTKPADFDTVIKNMSYAVKRRNQNGYKCVLGMQLLLLPENQHEAVLLAEIARDLGMDYLVIKPYSQNLFSKTDRYRNIKYSDYVHIADKLSSINTKKFSIVFRVNTMNKWDEGVRSYNNCLALPFWSYIDAGGNVWGCSAHLSNEKFCYGNIYDSCFKEIWKSEKRHKSLCWVESELDTSQCRVNCRMDGINRYLWGLKYPPEHVNFI